MKKSNYLIGIFIIFIDQMVKYIMIDKNYVIIPNFLKLTYTKNTGAAFGIGTNYIILAISSIIIVGIIIYMIKQYKNIINFIPYVLIISGSVGNVIDRIFRGFVIDYIDINLFNFPNFNIADICIVIGVFLLLIELTRNLKTT